METIGFLKTLIFICFAILTYFLIKTGYYGKAMTGITSDAYEQRLNRHNYWAKISYHFMLVSVILVEIAFRYSEADYSTGLGLYFHLACAFTFLFSFSLMRFWLTGLKNSIAHRRIFIIMAISYILTLMSGIPIIANIWGHRASFLFFTSGYIPYIADYKSGLFLIGMPWGLQKIPIFCRKVELKTESLVLD